MQKYIKFERTYIEVFLPLSLKLLEILLHALCRLAQGGHSGLSGFGAIVVRRHGQEEYLRNEIARPISLSGIEFFRSLLISIDLRLIGNVDPRIAT